MTIRTLILSGGGGRGAFHAGVYTYLANAHKVAVDAEHSAVWTPDVVVGTSIGAVNGAAIAQGLTPAELEQFWLTTREHHIQGLPPGMGFGARWFTNLILKRAIGVRLPQIAPEKAMSPTADESWPPLPVIPDWISNRIIGRWSNVLDTGPLFQSLKERLGLDEGKIAASPTTLLINATNIRTGEGVIFANRALENRSTGQQRVDCYTGITIKRIVASCSIPIMYPWTKDEDGEVYWDGALVANTPLGAAFDAVNERPIEEPMEIVVVLLNPWWDHNTPAPRYQQLPSNFGEAAAWALDWTMLASFRVSLRMLLAFNQLAEKNVDMGLPQQYRWVKVVMVAPPAFLPVERIIDYDEPASRNLIALGYAEAEKAFQKLFPPHP